jgi:hypothetical protein
MEVLRPVVRVVALLGTVLLYIIALSEVLPPYADLPPCHYMFVIAVAGAWTLALWRDPPVRVPPGHCPKCGQKPEVQTTDQRTVCDHPYHLGVLDSGTTVAGARARAKQPPLRIYALAAVLLGLAGTGLLIMSSHILGVGGMVSGLLFIALSIGVVILGVVPCCRKLCQTRLPADRPDAVGARNAGNPVRLHTSS